MLSKQTMAVQRKVFVAGLGVTEGFKLKVLLRVGVREVQIGE